MIELVRITVTSGRVHHRRLARRRRVRAETSGSGTELNVRGKSKRSRCACPPAPTCSSGAARDVTLTVLGGVSVTTSSADITAEEGRVDRRPHHSGADRRREPRLRAAADEEAPAPGCAGPRGDVHSPPRPGGSRSTRPATGVDQERERRHRRHGEGTGEVSVEAMSGDITVYVRRCRRTSGCAPRAASADRVRDGHGLRDHRPVHERRHARSTPLTSDPAEGAIAFTDLVGFTEFTATRGDEEALVVLRAEERIVDAALPDGARVVKELGDGLLCSLRRRLRSRGLPGRSCRLRPRRRQRRDAVVGGRRIAPGRAAARGRPHRARRERGRSHRRCRRARPSSLLGHDAAGRRRGRRGSASSSSSAPS